MNFIALKSTNYTPLILTLFICSLILAISYIGLIHFYLKGWLKTPNQNTAIRETETQGVSLIVAVRNESNNIVACLESVLKQSYPSALFEIIVVNDFSTDDTLQILENYQEKIRLVNLADHIDATRANYPNKKQAISLAVDLAKFPLVLCGDGDCTYGEYWVASMIQYYEKYNKGFVSGPVDYHPAKGFWHKFLLMDLVAMIGVTAGSIGQKRPVMASGANMLFEKKLFIQVNGYEGNQHVASGDDIFLMQKIFLKDNKAVGFVKNTKAFAYTYAPDTFGTFVHQRIRWTSKSGQMVDPQVQGVLILNYMFYLASFLNLFVLPWIDWTFLYFGVLLLGLKMLIDVMFFKNILAFYRKTDLLKWLLPLELLHIVYVSFMGVLAIFGQYSWKGRSIKK